MVKIVGILNITPDSFSDGGKFNSLEAALNQTKKLILEGADVIDVGAESTRPKATPIGAKEEWMRLEKILPAVVFEAKKLKPEIQVSIDSYHFDTIKKAHEAGVEIINDVSGLADEKIVEFIAERNLTTILMHSDPILANADLVINKNIGLNLEILNWARKKIFALTKKGVKKSQLIFDPGIGFGKDAQQSIRILKNLDAYRVLGLPLYVGHSKKSFLDSIKIEGDRAAKTLKITKFLAKKNVEFLRVHDVKENLAAIK
jgi:dihydropteroate synthase